MDECSLCGKNGEDLTLLSATTRTWGESWSVNSAVKSFGMKVVWYVELVAQAARVQAEDKNHV